MKRTLTLLCLLLPWLCQAQSYVTFGPKIGVGHSFFTGGDQPENQKLYPGLVAGGFLTVSGQSHWGLTVEAMYAARGAHWEPGNREVLQRFQYLDVPVYVRYFFNETGNAVRPNVFLGASANFMTKAKVKGDDASDDYIVNTDNWRRFDVGLLAGLGVNIRTYENQWLNLDARYNQGLRKVAKDNNDAFDNSAPNLYNGGVVLSVGYGFGI